MLVGKYLVSVNIYKLKFSLALSAIFEYKKSLNHMIKSFCVDNVILDYP